MRVNKKQAIEALEQSGGIVKYASDLLGCSRQTLYSLMDRCEDVRKARELAEEIELDIAEQKLNEAVRTGEPWAIKYKLSTRGKSRGYTDKPDTLDKDMIIQVNLVD